MRKQSDFIWVGNAVHDARRQVEDNPNVQVQYFDAVVNTISANIWLLFITPESAGETRLKQLALDLVSAQRENDRDRFLAVLIEMESIADAEQQNIVDNIIHLRKENNHDTN